MSIELNVKLYGTLSRSFDGYNHSSGLDVHLEDNSVVQDLLDYLKIDSKRIGMIVMDGVAAQSDSMLKNGAMLKILQPIAGG